MVDGVDHTRFTGLSGDPNYYSVNLILSFSGIILLNYRNELKFSFWLLFACLTIFGLLTLSKSFILMYFFVCIMLIYACVKKRKFFVPIIFCIAFIIILTLGIWGVIPIVNSIVERLTSFDDFNSLTTGRFNLWKMYLNYFDVNINTFILGNGILVRWLNDKAAHNTYIDFLYYLGLVGTILNLICWKVCFLACEEKRKLKLLNLCGITIIIIMYFFLSMFFAYDLIFHVMIAWIYFKMDLSYSKKQCDLSKTSVF
jgi:membrane protein